MALKGMRISAKDGMHYGNTRIEFDSTKNHCKIIAQSMLEYIEFMRLEFEPNVISYTPHPGTIILMDKQKEYRAVFDAEVHLTDGNILYEEIKYQSELENGNDNELDPFRSIRQVNIQKEWCKQNGYEYKLVTDEELIKHSPALLNNVLFINQRLRQERMEDIQEVRSKVASVFNYIKSCDGKCVINTIVNEFDPDIESVMTSVCYLLKEGFIETDLETKTLSKGSEVKIHV